jgi:hypothetical protein
VEVSERKYGRFLALQHDAIGGWYTPVNGSRAKRKDFTPTESKKRREVSLGDLTLKVQGTEVTGT